MSLFNLPVRSNGQIIEASWFNTIRQELINSGLSKINETNIPPTITNDVTQGFLVGALWLDTETDIWYICRRNNTGDALWTVMLTENSDAIQELVEDIMNASLTTGPHDGITVTYNDGSNKYIFANTDKGSSAVTTHEEALDPHPQYTTSAELTSALSAKQDTITGGATTITSSNLTINRALASDGSGKVIVSPTTAAELGYISGLASSAQTQINSKLDHTGGTATNTSIVTPARSDIKQDTYANLLTYAGSATNGQLVWATDVEKTYEVVDGLLRELGSGSGSGDGAKNFVTNGRFDADLSGWAVFKDAVSAIPEDGTGGAPTVVSISRITTNQLEGVGSLLITKSASNGQGEGCSYDLTFDRAREGANLYLTFLYEIASGTYTSGDLGVFFYDITNSKLVRLSDEVVKNSGLIEQHICNFQPDLTCVDGRIIFMFTTTTTNAFTMRVDEVFIGQIAKQETAIDLDWATFTPTGSFTNTTYTGLVKYKGDSADVKILLSLTGTPGAASLTVNLPFTIDIAKMLTTTIERAGLNSKVTFRDDGVDVYDGAATYNSSTSIRIQRDDGDGTLSTATQASPFTFGANDSVYIELFGVPVSGKTSTQVVVDEYANRDIVASLYNSTTSIGTSLTKVVFASTEVDTAGMASSSTITIKSAGWYLVSYVLYLVRASTTTSSWFSVIKNGNTGARLMNHFEDGISTYNEITASASDTMWLNVGDTLELHGVAGTAAFSLASVSGSAKDSQRFTVTKLGGNTTKLLPESIYFEYNSNSANSLNHNVDMIFEDLVKDPRGIYNPSTGVITAPVTGRLYLNGMVEMSSYTQVAGQYYAPMLMKNGVDQKYVGEIFAYISGAASGSFSFYVEIDVVAGDLIKIQSRENQTNSISMSTAPAANYIQGGYK